MTRGAWGLLPLELVFPSLFLRLLICTPSTPLVIERIGGLLDRVHPVLAGGPAGPTISAAAGIPTKAMTIEKVPLSVSLHEHSPLTALKTENARLIALLEDHGIEWRLPPEPDPNEPTPPVLEIEPSRLSTAEKVALFRRLFRGRTDVYPVRWEGKTTGKSGYAPACGNEWLADVWGKPRIKCGECNNRLLIPLSDTVIYEHLAGKRTIGVYPLLSDDTCHFLAADFDEAEWRDDTK